MPRETPLTGVGVVRPAEVAEETLVTGEAGLGPGPVGRPGVDGVHSPSRRNTPL